MRVWCRPQWYLVALSMLSLALLLAPVAGVASGAPLLTQLSSDPYTNTNAQHQTEDEPAAFAFGSTIVTAFNVGRFTTAGTTNTGWAVSTDSGATWTHGFLSGITKYTGGIYDRVSNPSVAYDPLHGVWLIAVKATSSSGGPRAVLLSRSLDGGHTWSAPLNVAVAPKGEYYDKPWVSCDTTASSPYYGRCYATFDAYYDSERIKMSTSTDGGLTWSAPKNTADNATGLGGQPQVQPNGTVIVPFRRVSQELASFVSTDGGSTWGASVRISKFQYHTAAGQFRAQPPLPSAGIDGAGKVYVAWQDCRLRTNCSANDILLSTSSDGLHWSFPTRVPIDDVTSTADHFIPGLGVDRATSGATAHLGLSYYYYPVASCSLNTCQLDVGYIASTDGGQTWSVATQLAGPMHLTWLAYTPTGRMVGDYMSTVFAGGVAYPMFAVGRIPIGSTYQEAIYTVQTGLRLGRVS